MFVSKQKIHDIIFEADTRLGKLFDVVLIILILLSVLVVVLETVSGLKLRYTNWFTVLEWIFTGLFTLEYILRIYVLKKPIKYILSTYGIIDLIAIIPLYLTYFASGAQVLMNFRILRLLRIFRVLKLVKFIGEANTLKNALKASRNKIAIFIYTIVILCVIIGTIMYLIEGGGRRIHQHSQKHLLDNCDAYYGWLWRHRTNNRVGSIFGLNHHDFRLWNHRSAHRYCNLRNDQTT